MAQTDAFKKYLDAGMAFSQLTRARAESIVKDLVAAGELQQKQTRSAIDDLVERSRKNAEAVGELVRTEVATQLSALGLATQADITRLETRIATLAPASSAAAPTPATVVATAPAKRVTAPAPAPAPAAPVKKVAASAKKATPAKKATKKA